MSKSIWLACVGFGLLLQAPCWAQCSETTEGPEVCCNDSGRCIGHCIFTDACDYFACKAPGTAGGQLGAAPLPVARSNSR